MKLNSSAVLKAGLIGAVIGFVAALIVQLPVLGCLMGWLGPIVALAVGALYVHFCGTRVEVAEGAAGGAVAGVIAAAVNAFVRGILDLIFRSASFFGGLVLPLILGAIFGAVAGALGGLIWALVAGRK